MENETADSIVVYVANKPKFVNDAYTTCTMDCLEKNGNYIRLQELFDKLETKKNGH